MSTGAYTSVEKNRHHDEWDPPIAPYDPYGQGTSVSGDDDFVAGDA
jgi:hypothetical protein